MKIWSDVEYVYRCLADIERTSAFRAAIQEVVRPGHIVLDLGTGSGIMALFAAEAGARKVYATEIGSHLFQSAVKTFEQSPHSGRIIPVHMDAQELTLEVVEKPDVVICEMITTGLIGEMQGPVLNTLRRSGIVDDQTRIIPAGLSTSVALAHADFVFFGNKLHFPLFVDYFTRAFDRSYQLVSEEKAAHFVQFSTKFRMKVHMKEAVTVNRFGQFNALLMKSSTKLTSGIELGTCISYCQPVILPLKEASVSEGDSIPVCVEYEMGAGFDSLKYSVGTT